MTHSAKSVRSATSTDYQCASQGNIASARNDLKRMHNANSKVRTGGTDNLVRAAFGMDGAKMCRVVDSVSTTDRIGTQHSNKFRGYSDNTAGLRRSDSTVQHTGVSVTGMSWEYIMRKCARLDITLVEYCEMYDFPLEAIARLAPSA